MKTGKKPFQLQLNIQLNNSLFSHPEWPDCSVCMMSSNSGYLGIHGSGFLVRRKEHLFLATARHCLGNLNNELLKQTAASLLIPAKQFPEGIPYKSPQPDDYINFSNIFLAKSDDRLDEYVGNNTGDWDLAILSIPQKENPHYDLIKSRSITVNSDFSFIKDVRRGVFSNRFVVQGYPKNVLDAGIDYDNNIAIHYKSKIMGRYSKRGNYPHTDILTVTDTGEITDFDGFSGSPIYARHNCGGRNYYTLLGMMIGGGSSSRSIEFIGYDYIYSHIERVIDSISENSSTCHENTGHNITKNQ